MKPLCSNESRARRPRGSGKRSRRLGAFLVLSALCLTFCFAFVSLAVDIGYVNLTKQRMQNAVDAAALAAAQEITNAVRNAPPGTPDITLYALQSARLVAERVAELNGVYISPDDDVIFGQRTFDPLTETFEITWDTTPANVVKVVARRDAEDMNAPDAKLSLFFAGVIGSATTSLRSEAAAYVEARDIVVVHDFSRSMNFDTYFASEASTSLPHAQILNNLSVFYQDWNPSVPPSLTYWPRHLEVSASQDGIEGTATFRHNQVDVTSNASITSVRLLYTDGAEQTIAVPGGSTGTFQGTGENASKDIAQVDVTCEMETEPAGVDQDPVTLTGAQPTRGSHALINVTFSGDRESIQVSSSKDLSNVVLEFCDGIHYKFDGLTGKTGTFAGFGGNAGKILKRVWIKSGSRTSGDGPGYGERFINPTNGADCGPPAPTIQEVTLQFFDSDANVLAMLGLSNTPYPYPSGSWNSMISHGRSNTGWVNAGFREMYGGMTFANYVLRSQSGSWQTPDLWKTRHYPFEAIKEGHELFCDFLGNLGFGDEVGMVSYDSSHRWETVLNHPDPNVPVVDISGDPISSNYESVINLMKYKQAAQYSYSTNMGGGLSDSIAMLDAHARTGTRKAILLMTDGNTNTIDSGVDTGLPADWNWDELLDYDGNGVRDYYTNSSHKTYLLRLAYEAREAGIFVHTMSVGADADTQLMAAIAHLTNGHHINVPGGQSVYSMQAQVEEAFHRIASFVPPAKLLYLE